jgi:hypothetical protein
MGDEDKNVPSHTKEALERYWTYGYDPGGFLTTLLTGDVFNAVLRADHWNKMELGHIVYYIVHKAPRGSYGSTALVQDWINRGVAFQQHQKNRVVDYLSN